MQGRFRLVDKNDRVEPDGSVAKKRVENANFFDAFCSCPNRKTLISFFVDPFARFFFIEHFAAKKRLKLIA